MFRRVDDKQAYNLFVKVMTEVVGTERGAKEKGVSDSLCFGLALHASNLLLTIVDTVS